MEFLICIAGVLIGALYVASPETGWFFSYGWRFKDTEPSDAALLWMRIVGVVMVVAGGGLGLFLLFGQ